MIKVTVELVSAVDPKRSRVLGIAKICNDGSGTAKYGNYTVELSKWAPKLSQTWKKGIVLRFDRLKLGPWDLLYHALHVLLTDRNDDVYQTDPDLDSSCGE